MEWYRKGEIVFLGVVWIWGMRVLLGGSSRKGSGSSISKVTVDANDSLGGAATSDYRPLADGPGPSASQGGSPISPGNTDDVSKSLGAS